jgi:hypothetical protein
MNHRLAPYFPHLVSRQTAYSQLVLALSSDPLRSPTRGSKAGFLDTSVGPATLVLYYQLTHFMTGPTSAPSRPPFSEKECRWCAHLLHEAVSCVTHDEEGELPEHGCELLYGRAGLLYALLLLRQSLPASSSSSPNSPDGIESLYDLIRPLTRTATIKIIVDDIMRRGRQGAARFAAEARLTDGPGFVWMWHGKRYLGGAHGIGGSLLFVPWNVQSVWLKRPSPAGILTVILHAPESLIVPHADGIARTLTYLLFLQDPAGNWPTTLSARPTGAKASDLVQYAFVQPSILAYEPTRPQMVPRRDGRAPAVRCVTRALAGTRAFLGHALRYTLVDPSCCSACACTRAAPQGPRALPRRGGLCRGTVPARRLRRAAA